MKRKLILGIMLLALLMLAPLSCTEPMVLSNYPKLFEKDAMIIVGKNASQVELESAEEIAANLEELTGNKPAIKNDNALTEDDKTSCNLILVGTPESNELLEQVYNLTNATRVTKEYPGEYRGILEILRNPWNEDRVLLLVAGSDGWGAKAGSTIIQQPQELNEVNIVVQWEDSGAVIVQLMSIGKQYPGEPFRVEEYNVSEVIEKAKETNHWVRYGSAYGPPYTYYNGSESKRLYIYGNGYVGVEIYQKDYSYQVESTNAEDPTNYELRVKFLIPMKTMNIKEAQEIVKGELAEIGINLRDDEEIEWDLTKGFIPPKLLK
jgi:hypothetical protein